MKKILIALCLSCLSVSAFADYVKTQDQPKAHNYGFTISQIHQACEASVADRYPGARYTGKWIWSNPNNPNDGSAGCYFEPQPSMNSTMLSPVTYLCPKGQRVDRNQDACLEWKSGF